MMIRIHRKDGSIDYAELTYAELISTIVVLGIIGQLVMIILSNFHFVQNGRFIAISEEYSVIFSVGWSLALGWWIGIAAAIFLARHLYNNVSDVIMMETKDANDVLRHNMIIRYAIVFVLMTVIYLTKVANPVTYVIGVMMLKPAAYLQPLADKIYIRFFDKTRREVK